MNPYQRIPGVQQGHIDTQAKFRELLSGESLEGLRVVDLGCNVGMMSKLALEAGAAYVLGIDERFDYIQSARELWTHVRWTGETTQDIQPKFDCRPIHKLAGRFDVGILSACYHYLQDPRPALRQMARCCDRVFMDVWLYDASDIIPRRVFDHGRELWVPDPWGFKSEVKPYWRTVNKIGDASAPDGSERWIYHLDDPIRTKPKATLIHGLGGSGKTTLAKSFHDREILHTDEVHVERWVLGMHTEPSILRYHEAALRNSIAHESWRSYTQGYIGRWLASRVNLDVVIEGYDLTVQKLRDEVRGLLEAGGWDIEEVEL